MTLYTALSAGTTGSKTSGVGVAIPILNTYTFPLPLFYILQTYLHKNYVRYFKYSREDLKYTGEQYQWCRPIIPAT